MVVVVAVVVAAAVDICCDLAYRRIFTSRSWWPEKNSGRKAYKKKEGQTQQNKQATTARLLAACVYLAARCPRGQALRRLGFRAPELVLVAR